MESEEIIRSDEGQNDIICNDIIGFDAHCFRSLDSKKRLIMPAEFKDYLGTRPFHIMCFPIERGDCLRIYNEKDYIELMKQRVMQEQDKAKRLRFQRFLYSRADARVLDSQNRFTLDQECLDFANIDKEVYVLGLDRHIELWNIESYKRKIAGDMGEEYYDFVPDF